MNISLKVKISIELTLANAIMVEFSCKVTFRLNELMLIKFNLVG